MRLENNKKYMEKCLSILNNLITNKHYDDAAYYAQKLSTHAWLNFTGYFSLWKFEIMLGRLGNCIPKIGMYERKKNKKILHICTELYSIGGHTKLLFNWIENSKDYEHSIMLTKQNEVDDVISKFNYSLENFIFLDSVSILDKAFELKNKAKNFEHVILHIHPDDVIPIIAFSDDHFKTPILFNNHADHIFWLGNSIIDILIQIRESNIEKDKIRRGLENSYYLPILIDTNKLSLENTKLFNKEKDIIYLLTTGQEYKYIPTARHNFFETIFKILEKYEHVILLFAGIAPDSKIAKSNYHERIKYLGKVKNIEKYENICDIYLEGFPISSFMALLQPALKGKYVQLMYDPPQSVKLFEDKNKPYFDYPFNENKWIESLSMIIEDKELRIKKAKQQKEFLLNQYSIQSWKSKFALILGSSNKMEHKINRQKKSDVFFSSDDEVLIADSYRVKFNHFTYTYKLNFMNRIKNIIIYCKNKDFLIDYNVKELIAYLINKR